jgi:HK97 family phage major capsid protein
MKEFSVMPKSITEQILALESTREAKQKELNETVQKSLDEGRSMDAAEREQFDTLESEIKSLDGDLDRMRRLERAQKASARPVDDDAAQVVQRSVTDVRPNAVRVEREPKLEKGIAFARYARVKLLAQIDRTPIENVVKSMYPGDERLLRIVKAPVSAASTLDAEWAANMINEGSAFADFVEFLRPRTVLGQVSGLLRTLPFDTPVLVQNSGAVGAWVKDGDAKPVSQWSYSRVKLAPLTVAAITAVTKKLLMRASPAADALFRDELARAVGATIDSTFIDPDVQAVADESPGSILNGVVGLTPSGNPGVAGVRCDIETLLNQHNDANLSFDGLFWLMSGRNAIALSQMTNEIGNLAYPTVTPTGGTLAGFPVYVTNYAPTDSDGSLIALVKGSEIYLGDEGGIDVAMSDQASLVMDSAPSMDSVTPTAAQVVSMFQTNSVAMRVERFLNWQRRRAAAVAWMAVNWTACAEGS